MNAIDGRATLLTGSAYVTRTQKPGCDSGSVATSVTNGVLTSTELTWTRAGDASTVSMPNSPGPRYRAWLARFARSCAGHGNANARLDHARTRGLNVETGPKRGGRAVEPEAVNVVVDQRAETSCEKPITGFGQ